MHIHDAHRIALLVVCLRRETEIKPSRKKQHCDAGKPGQHPGHERQESGWIGEVADFGNGKAVVSHDAF